MKEGLFVVSVCTHPHPGSVLKLWLKKTTWSCFCNRSSIWSETGVSDSSFKARG